VLGIVLGHVAVHAQAPGEPNVTTVRIPLTEKRFLGKGRELTLEGTLFRPSADGVVPLLVFNHGSTGRGRGSPTETLTYPEVARFFVERGIAVLVPMRRGRGASDGDYLERYDCDTGTLSAGLDRAIEDMDAVMAFVSVQAWVDRGRLLLGGMSRGGFLSIVYASMRPTGARGVIDMAGGWTVEVCDQRVHFHASTLAGAGRSAKLPTLWLYSENDRNYGPAAVRAYHRAFTGAGGAAELHLFGPIGHDGHILLPRSVSVWAGAVDAFLQRIGVGRRD
jgi:pimeloyl-ACP methyl ester carboxylesterase